MTSPPSHWLDTAMGWALRLLAIAVVLYIAVRLIEAVWPVLVGLAVAALLGLAGWSVYQFRRSRW